jgi:hypothetical protein
MTKKRRTYEPRVFDGRLMLGGVGAASPMSPPPHFAPAMVIRRRRLRRRKGGGLEDWPARISSLYIGTEHIPACSNFG